MTQAATLPQVPAASVARSLSQWEFWGRMLVVPYLLIFVVFVLYPVGYGI
jgi:multiple sugar transport system permease protein